MSSKGEPCGVQMRWYKRAERLGRVLRMTPCRIGSHNQRGVLITRWSERNCARKRRSAGAVGASGLPVLVSRTPVVFGGLWMRFFAGIIKASHGAIVLIKDFNDSPSGWLFRISQKKIKRRCDYFYRGRYI